jgi:putative ABC transport system permease protein
LGRIGGEPARLAGRYLKDSGIRAAVSVGALITAVALFCALTIMVYSFRHTVEAWVNQSISGDLFIRPKMAEINRYRDPIPPELIRVLKNLDAPVDLAPYHRIYLDYGKIPYQFETIDFDVFRRYGSFLWVSGDPESALSRAARGEGVLVSEVFANRTGLGPGDPFRTILRSGTMDVPVLGVIRDYRTRGGVVFYSLPHFDRRFGHPDWNGMRIFFRDRGPGLERATQALRNRILRLSGGALEVTEGPVLRRTVLRIFDETFAVSFVLMLIALAVAALGVASTLTVLVLERSWQFNTILAVGGSPAQIRAVVLWEAALMTSAALMAGLLCGLMLSYLLIFVINRQSFGWTFLYRIDWASIGASVPLILAAALLSALPSLRLVFADPPATLLREG